MRISRSIKLVCLALWALAIPMLSLLPPRFFHNLLAQSAPTIPGTDKVVHALMYAILTVLMLWTLIRPNQRLEARKIWDAVVLAALYGALMEVLQGLSNATLHRSADIWDEFANVVGAMLVAIIWLLGRLRQPKSACRAK